MKNKALSYASRMAVIALTFVFAIGVTSCGDDDSPSVDELLSEETTPITFDLGEKGTHFLFDYAGNNYVGADTINVGWDGRAELNLRRGKHQLLWITGLSQEEYGVHFDPISKEVKYRTSYGWDVHFSEPISYAQLDIDVTEYLRPTQQLEYASVMSRVVINVEDSSPLVEVVLNQWNTLIGKMSGFPVVSSVSLYGKNYVLGESSSANIYAYPYNKERQTTLRPGEMPSIGVGSGYVEYILCPLNGLDNIQLTAEVHDKDGNPIPTVPLPKFSLRRGHTTVLRGPLFSGTTSDWVVTMNEWGE